MLDIKLIRENPELVKNNMKRKGRKDSDLVEQLLKEDEKWRKIKYDTDQLKSQRNKVSQEINSAKKEGKDIKPLIKSTQEYAKKLAEQEKKRVKQEEILNEILGKIPNIIADDVPEGLSDKENVVIKSWGKTEKKKVLDHGIIAEKLGVADFDTSAKVSGNGFYYLKGPLALLNQALIQFAIDFMFKQKYEYIETPLMIRAENLGAAVDGVEFKNSIYEVKDTDLVMIGTAEHALLSMHVNETLNESELPKKYFSYSMCFRKEIGSHGLEEKGLFRTHQFNKVEQFIFCAPEDSGKLYEELLKNSEGILQALKLPYRVLDLCAGDLASWKYKSLDLEVYRPTTNDYMEVMSLSNCTDYQARKLNTKMLRKNGERVVLHTLNNTAMATSRILVAILENYQNPDGSISVPEVLKPYMHGIKEIK